MRIVSLFANIGVAEACLHELNNVSVVVANKWQQKRTNLYHAIYPESDIICGDITDELFQQGEVLNTNFIRNYKYESIILYPTIKKTMDKKQKEVTYINKLKVVLAEENLTSKWLADKLGKDPGTVSKWCTNNMQPNLETLRGIALCLDINVTELLWPTKEQ